MKKGAVTFVHDNSDFPPEYKVTPVSLKTVAEGNPSKSLIFFNGNQAFPLLTQNSLFVNQGTDTILTTNILSASDGTANQEFVFEVSDVKNSHFAFVNDPMKKIINTFTSSQIKNSQIILIHDENLNSPNYKVKVSTITHFVNGISDFLKLNLIQTQNLAKTFFSKFLKGMQKKLV